MKSPAPSFDLATTLADHPLSRSLRDAESVRIFMEHHVYAVWDFMSLLKSLQADLCGTTLPWTPPRDPEAARFVNEIVLDEETDEVAPGRYLSHFAWYLEAMEEMGASLAGIRSLLAVLQRGAPLAEAARGAPAIPEPARRFLLVSAEVLDEPLAVRAAVFLRARESIIPRLFAPIVRELAAGGLACPTLLAYLERHIAVDGEDHGPRAHALVDRLLAAAPEHRERAESVALRALEARQDLWNDLHSAVRVSAD
ncbi:MAG: DUF3050 domain-containing protein [Planctomycetota bacterium]